MELRNSGDTESGIYVSSVVDSQTGNSATDKEKIVCRSFHIHPTAAEIGMSRLLRGSQLPSFCS
jgi:hypothetical protein